MSETGQKANIGTMEARSTVALAPPRIAIRGLDFYYGSNHALKSVNLDFPDKQVTGMIGPSGCGKSTLLRCLNRMYDLYPGQRATGEVMMDGDNIIAPGMDLNQLRSRIGMVFQKPTPFPMTIYDNIAFGVLAARTNEQVADGRAGGMVALTAARRRCAGRGEGPGWPPRRHGPVRPGSSSGLCIARTIAVRPEVILFDEPTSALDPIQHAEDRGTDLDELKHDFTIAIVTHNMQQAARCADQVAFFYLGEMVEVGTAAQSFTAPHQRRTQEYITGRFG